MRHNHQNGLPWLAGIVSAAILFLVFAPQQVVAQEGTGPLPLGQGGRIWNISDTPFEFRLRRAGGEIWTEIKTLAPNQYQVIKLPKLGERAELEGLDVSDPHLSIEYSAFGGVMRFRLPARSSSGKVVPFWFIVKDSNGFSRLIQADGLGEAEKVQAGLKATPPVKPEEIEALKRTLQANWVFYPNVSFAGSTSTEGPLLRGWSGRCCP